MRLINADRIDRNMVTVYDYKDQKWVHIWEMPTVDAVEVVRCKDCKFYWKNNRDSDGVVCLATPKDNAFCSEGGRKEDD